MFTGFLVALLYQLFGPSPPIIVSEDTTVITSPLGEDGLPDYQKYWRHVGREGVTHENNAAVLFWRAVWPGELNEEDRRLVSDVLGFDVEPESSDALQTPYSREVRDALMVWMVEEKQRGVSGKDSQGITSQEHPHFWAANHFAEEVVDAAMTRPWTSEEIPPLADWVAKNEKAFELLVEASKRPKWWSPAPALFKDRAADEFSIPMSGIQTAREVAWALSVRAMWHAGEGRPRESWNDLKATLQLARFLRNSSSLVSQLTAIAIDGIALDKTITLLQHGAIDATTARQILGDLIAMEKACDVAGAFDTGERTTVAEIAILMARDNSQLAILDISVRPYEVGNFAGCAIDWNVVLEAVNRWHDRLVGAASPSDYKQRLKKLGQLTRDISHLEKSVNDPVRYATSFLNIAARSRFIADCLISLMLFPSGAAIAAEDRAVLTLDLARVAAALAVYRAEEGEYPERLDQLVPGVMAKVPDDLYSGKPFVYRTMPDGGYLLYSVFENGEDDGGTVLGGEIVEGEWQEISEAEFPDCDKVIRVPMPKFELPPVPEMDE